MPLAVEGPAHALVARGSAAPDFALSLPESVPAPVRAGDRLGTLTVTLDGEVLETLPVVAAEDVPRLGFGGIWLRLAKSLFGL